MEPIQPICRMQSFLEPRFSLVKNKQLQLGHLAGCIYPGEALKKGCISVFWNRLWSRTAVRFADFRISAFAGFTGHFAFGRVQPVERKVHLRL